MKKRNPIFHSFPLPFFLIDKKEKYPLRGKCHTCNVIYASKNMRYRSNFTSAPPWCSEEGFKPWGFKKRGNKKSESFRRFYIRKEETYLVYIPSWKIWIRVNFFVTCRFWVLGRLTFYINSSNTIRISLSFGFGV